MTRISKRFHELRKENSKAFIPYIMAGDPSIQRTRQMINILVDCGADIIELGVPFSDPLADGPTIQMAAQRALANGVNLHRVIDLVADIRVSIETPIILMTYYNPVFKYGEERFVEDASASGVDGVIVPDLPPDEAIDLVAFARKKSFDTIFLLAPTSTEDRIKKVAHSSSGFIYYVSITGITGAKLSIESSIKSSIAHIREISSKPVAVGFGISTPEEASVIAGVADGVIVGSAIVKRINDPDADISSYLNSMKKAINRTLSF